VLLVAKTRTSSTVKRRYNQKAYDRVEIVVPKGDKETVKVAAEGVGESLNQYVGKAILSRMGLAEWPNKNTAGDHE
jgi:predicted HicB family RNase H-like nuclease